MSKFDLDIKQLVKDAIVEKFDEDIFIEQLSLDICQSNPEWWAEKIVNPLRDTLNKAILEDKDFIKAIIWEYMDREFYGEVKDKLKHIIYEYVGAKVKKIMPEFDIVFKDKKKQ